MDVANATPTHAMKGIEICSYILKLVNKNYENERFINYDALRKAVARRDEIHKPEFAEELSKREKDDIEKNYECALRTKVSIYRQLVDRRTMLGYAKGSPAVGIEEELEIVNAKIYMLEEEGIDGYIKELSALTAARNAEREEADRRAEERAEEIMAIAEEVRNEKAQPKAVVRPQPPVVDETSDLV
jgi:hypothetical protein